MKKKRKGLFSINTVAVNKYDEDKNVVYGEWGYKVYSLFGIPFYTNVFRRDTDKMITTKKKNLGFK